MKSRWKEINRFPLSDPLKSNIPDTKIDRVKYFFLSSTVYTAYSLHSIESTQHRVYTACSLHNIQSTQHSLHSIQSTQHTVYTTYSLHNISLHGIQSTQHTVYTAYSLHSIQAYKRIKGPRLKLLFENRNNQLPDIIILQRSSVPWVFVKLQAIPVFHPNT